MSEKCIAEKELRARSGFFMLFALIVGFFLSLGAFICGAILMEAGTYLKGSFFLGLGILLWIVIPILSAGFKVVHPNEARIFTLFGNYHGTLENPGFYYVNPFCITFSPTYEAAKVETEKRVAYGNISVSLLGTKKAISLKKQTLDNKKQKVNDSLGNPIIIGAIVIWHVKNPTQAVFGVENFCEYLSIQTDSVIRNVSRLYPYDVFDEDEVDDGVREKTLRGSALEIAEVMQGELQKRVLSAGLEIEEVRITHLAYAEEIAAAMLQRQQAAAIIAARQKIVDGAVGMVKMAIDKLGEDDIIILDEERKAAMVSNLLVVLCGNKDAQPIINSGTIY